MTKEQMAEVRNYTIYALMFPDSSEYIGVTSEEKLYDRMQYGNGYKKEPVFEAIMNFGWNNIQVVPLVKMRGNWYEAHAIEVEQIQAAVKLGTTLWNKDHTKPPKEHKYKLDGVTLTDINRYFETYTAAAAFIGVTKQAVRLALAENRPCKGWNLEYGNTTVKEEEENVNT